MVLSHRNTAARVSAVGVTAVGLTALGACCAAGASAHTVVDTPHTTVASTDEIPVAGGTSAVTQAVGVPFSVSDGSAGTVGDLLP